jgi:hypothetical protein
MKRYVWQRTTPTSQNKILNRLPSFDIIFYSCTLVCCSCTCMRLAVLCLHACCCAALRLCACAVLVCLHVSVRVRGCVPACVCAYCRVVLVLVCSACRVVLVCVCYACLHACVRVPMPVLVCVFCCACRAAGQTGRAPSKAGQAPVQDCRLPDAPLPRLGRLRPWPGRRTRLAPGWQRP